VALLHILRSLVPDTLMGVAHFNHGLRGAESDEDEQFVAALAGQFGLPFYRSDGKLGAGNLEQHARRARAGFFRELIEQRVADRVAVGHTLDDQAETVLFRLLRGSGLSGLAGILPVTAEGIIRPLIQVRREDVRGYLRDRRIGWREDSSNQSSQFTRNRIRQTLLPELARDWNPQIEVALAQLADVAYEEEVWWASEVARHASAWIVGPGSVEMSTPLLASMPRALLRRLMRHAIRHAKGDLLGIDHSHIEFLVDLTSVAKGSASRALPGLMVVQSFDWLALQAPAGDRSVEPVAVRAPGTYLWRHSNPMIQLVINSAIHAPNACDTLDLELRGWRAGDAYWPLGHQHPAKLKDLFQKARVPSWRRASWPMITGKGKILWAKEFGPSVDASGLSIWEIPYTD